MSAGHINQNQLAMFLPASEIAKMNLGDSPSQQPEMKATVLQRKGQEVKDRPEGRFDGPYDFDKKGIEKPLSVAHGLGDVKYNAGRYSNEPTLLNGHHRLAWALDKDPSTEVPIAHTDAMNPRSMDEYQAMGQDRIERRKRIGR